MRHTEYRKTVYCLCGKKEIKIFLMCSNILSILCFGFYLKIWCFPWERMQIALLSSAKSPINNTYTRKVLMNGFKFWNAVSVGLKVVLLKHFLLYQINDLFEICLKMYIYFSFQKNLKPLEVTIFFGWPRLRQLYDYKKKVIFIQ